MLKLFLILALALPALAQNPVPFTVTQSDPTGNACGSNSVVLKTPTGSIYTCQNGAYAQASGGGATGQPPYTQSVSGVSSLTITAATHLQGTKVSADCFDNSTPANAVSCSYTVSAAGAVAFSFGSPFTGYVQIQGGGTGVQGPTGAIGATGPSGGPAGPTGATGATGATGSFAANAEYTSNYTLTTADCSTGGAIRTLLTTATTFTLIAPIAGCNVIVQNNNASSALTLNLTTNSVTGNNGSTSNITAWLPACPSQPSGCASGSIKANGTSNWDISLGAGLTGATGPSGANGATGATGATGSSATPGVTITTGTSATLSTPYTFNQNATAGAAVAYTLPTASAGAQYCVDNAQGAGGANTGALTVNTSASGQFIIFTDGTYSATGGNVVSPGAARDGACFSGIDATHWMFYPHSASGAPWTKN